MKVTLIQPELVWEDSPKNLERLTRMINESEAADLVVLPEMFNTGFTMRPEQLAEPTDGPAFRWMQSMARSRNCVITGSIATKEGDKFFNRLYWMRPDGSYETYDKRHLFRMGREEQHYAAGKKKLIVELKGWKICPLVCYDLRFPVWSRNRFEGGAEYDLLIYVANWPKVRSYAWKHLLIARAIENQAYVIGVNRVGADGNQVEHSGNSMVIDFKGQIMSEIAPDQGKAMTIELDRTALMDFRKSFPAGLDADRFTIL